MLSEIGTTVRLNFDILVYFDCRFGVRCMCDISYLCFHFVVIHAMVVLGLADGRVLSFVVGSILI